MQQDKKIHNATVAIMLLGVALSLIQFLYNRSLWLDEATLSLNIINRDYSGLLQPLDYTQVAPVGFLIIEKFFSTLIPNSEYGLRIFPLLCYWASVYLFYRVVNVLLNDKKITLLAVSLFCLNISLLYYAAEVKQYMVDAFVCLLLHYIFLKEYKNSTNRYILLALLGMVSIFLSNVSVIVLCSVAIVLIIENHRKYKENFKFLFFVFISWAAVFATYFSLFIHNHPSRNAMLAYWKNSFMPLTIFASNFWKFCFYKTKMIFGDLLFSGATGNIAFMCFLIGVYVLVKNKRKKMLFLLLFPAILQVTLSAFKLYPFDLRLILYQAGFYIIVIAIGVAYAINLSIEKTKNSWLVWLSLVFPIILSVELFKNYPAKVEEIKKSIDFISTHIQPNEAVYIYYGAIPAFTYYRQIGKIKFNNQLISGNGFRGENQKYVDEIKNNKQKQWILFSHIYDDENSYIITSLDSVAKKEFVFKTEGSEVYFYNRVNNLY